MSEPLMTYHKTVEHYTMLLPDKSEVIVEVHHNNEMDGAEVQIEVKNKETNELIEDFEFLGYVKRFLFENTYLFGD